MIENKQKEAGDNLFLKSCSNFIILMCNLIVVIFTIAPPPITSTIVFTLDGAVN